MVQKWPFFQLFFLSNLDQDNVFYDILERKNAFLRFKKQEVQKVEKLTFFPRDWPMFLVQNGHFSNFFFLGNLDQENVFCDILERKNAFLRYKNKKLHGFGRKIDIFPRGLTHGFDPKMAIFPTFFFRIFRAGKCLLRYSWTKKRLSTL